MVAEPDKATQAEQIVALQHFCNADDLYLLSTIAAYPELHWVLTQRLESELFKQQPPKQREQRLLKLLRLPWLRFGQIPYWLRQTLHQQQSRQQQQDTHQLYTWLFKQAQINQHGELQLPFNPDAHRAKPRRAYLRWLNILRQASRNTSQNTIWEDQIFATTLLGKKPFELDRLLPKSLAKAIPQGRWRTVYPQVAGVLLLSLLLGSVLQQGWQHYGNPLAQDYWIEDYPLKQLLAKTPVNISISQPARYQTGAEMLRFEQQKQAATILKAALEKQGFKGKISIAIQKSDQKSDQKTGQKEEKQEEKQAVNQPSLISYIPPLQQAANLLARQLKHLGWGLKPALDNTGGQTQGINVQLNQLTQAGTTFRDTVSPRSTAQKKLLGELLGDKTGIEKALTMTPAFDELFNKDKLPAMQPFTLFRDTFISKSDNTKQNTNPKQNNKQNKKQNKANVIPAIPTMIALPAGEFLMGSPEDEPERDADESPQHKVELKAFAISQAEITFAQYDNFAEATQRKKPDDEGWGRGNRPVINVSWNDATAYVNWLSEQTGQAYRLPSEAEWEYATRAGTATPFYTGDCIHTDLANYNGNYDYNDCGAKTETVLSKTVPVTQLPPNPWGLFGVQGNVWEWVEDCWHDNYKGAPADGSVWQEAKCDRRVVRGGGWSSIPVLIRSANRDWLNPVEAFYFAGFRIARAL